MAACLFSLRATESSAVCVRMSARICLERFALWGLEVMVEVVGFGGGGGGVGLGFCLQPLPGLRASVIVMPFAGI